MPRISTVFFTVFLCGCSDDQDRFGPHWSNEPVEPDFVSQAESSATSFTGWVSPKTVFVEGVAEGFSLEKPRARFTLLCAAVWAHMPVYVSLHDGSREAIGSDETLLARWEVPPPDLDGTIEISESKNLSRPATWMLVEFEEFAGQCNLEVLGHD